MLIVAWVNAPGSRSLWIEVAKTSLQVIAIAVIGGLVSLLTFSYQQRRLAVAKDLEVRRDERSRADELLRSTLEETLRSYNRVKRIRRLLDADTGPPDHRDISIEVYDRHLRELVDHQLAFEQFKRSAFQIDDVIVRQELYPQTETQVSVGSLGEKYTRIEKYLNEVIKEYKKKRSAVSESSGGVDVAALPELSSFIGHKFVKHVSDELDEVLDVLQATLLKPLNSSNRHLPPDSK